MARLCTTIEVTAGFFEEVLKHVPERGICVLAFGRFPPQWHSYPLNKWNDFTLAHRIGAIEIPEGMR